MAKENNGILLMGWPRLNLHKPLKIPKKKTYKNKTGAK